MPTPLKAVTMCKKLQGIIVERIEALQGLNDLKADSVIAQLSRSWETLENRKRILEFKPAPKPIEVNIKGQVARRGKKGGGILRPTAFNPGAAEPEAPAPTTVQTTPVLQPLTDEHLQGQALP